ncbi:class I SAM-dependent methyltransferase [Actinomadura sp. NTSP31]|uniref:class I SAM-dependent methyltransferase n=1 Tax=Actinomadura sp. NTSP31 TaxID=1735447 RepID=UPI0035C12D69
MRDDIGGVDTGAGGTWASGDYARVGNRWLLVSELLCETAGIRPGERVLDVATGTGNTALAAARRFADVTGVDYVPALLEQARARAAAEGLDVRFEAGDALELPHPDGAFDVAVSTFGVQYVPDQERAAAELLRVVRPGGRIALASWSPGGYLGELLRLVDRYTAGASGEAAPTLWGTAKHLERLLGPHASALECTERQWRFRFRSPADMIGYFRAHFGPLKLAFDVLDAAGRDALTTDLTRHIEAAGTAPGGTVEVPSAYLEAVAVLSP